MSESIPSPRRHEESPAPRSENGKIVAFPASRPVLHDRVPEPEPFANGLLDSFRSKLPTPVDGYPSALAASHLRAAVVDMGVESMLADTFIDWLRTYIDERVEVKLREHGGSE